MTEEELRKKCGLKPRELLDTNLGFLEILNVRNDIVTLGVLETGQYLQDSCKSVIKKYIAFQNFKKKKDEDFERACNG
ncbi:MAG: hypothetical protein ACFFG0_04045 [Candidatus Thorarchaeota archaeon]